MRSNRKHSDNELEEYICLYLEDGISYKTLTEEYGLLLSRRTFFTYVTKYKAHGYSSIQTKTSNNHYSHEFKLAVVQEYLDNQVPLEKLALKYNIPSHQTVKNWIIKYTKEEEIKDTVPKPEVYTMKGQKKTQEEKIEIVKDYLAGGMSYRETAEKHRVSYNNVYSWVQKYRKHGPAGLIDGRGRRKPESIQTEEEKLKTENVALKARNEYLETENAALKKLKEVERELMLQEQYTKQNSRRLRNLRKKDTK